MITFIQDQKYFLIDGKGFSYALGISPKGDLHHLHWGAPLAPHSLMTLLTEWRTRTADPTVILENQRREFPDFGHNDLRNPAFHLEHADGSRISHFVYSSHEILPGKPAFEGPCSYVEDSSEAETLKIVLRDELKDLDLSLYYTVYSQWGILARRTVLQNNGAETIHALKLMRTGIDLPGGDYQLLSFAGAWAH